MLRITPSLSADGAKSYFDKTLSRGDYYLKNEHQKHGLEIIGDWHGHGAEMLGLSGQVDRESFHALCDNLKPIPDEDGKFEKLTPRVRKRVGYDFTFSAPKSVSVLYGVGDDKTKSDIMTAFRSAVHDTMGDIEAEMKTQARDDGKKIKPVTGNMVWAEFIHTTARPVDGVSDPHLHTHAFAFNATKYGNQWRAGEFGGLKRDGSYFQAAFDVRLANNLQEIGYDIEKTTKRLGNRQIEGWEIEGVRESVIDEFSKRTQEIEDEAQKQGITNDREKDELGARTRQAKQSDLSLRDHETIWKERLTDDETNALPTTNNSRSPPVRLHQSCQESIDYAKNHAFERASTISERQLITEALKHGVGSVSLDGVQQEFERQVQKEEILTGDNQGRRFVTTREIQQEEKAMINFAKYGRGTCKPLFNGEYEYKDDLFRDSTKDTSEQKAVIDSMLGSYDRVQLLRGAAGAGKTTAMIEVANGIREGGKEVLAFAPTGKATNMLKSSGFDNADTLQRLLVDESMQKQTRDQVIWVDEAGMVGTKDMRKLFGIADQQNARVILTGDTKQHHSVSRGDSMRILEMFGGVKPLEITKIRRQTNEGYKKVVSDIRENNMDRAFDRLDKLGAIVEIDTYQRYQQLTDDYLQAVADGKSAVVVSPTHREGERVTESIRLKLKQTADKKAKPLLGNDDREFTRMVNLNWTEAERGQARNYQEGMIVQFHQNVKGVKRGEKLRIVGQESGNLIAVNDKGKKIDLPLAAATRFNVYRSESLKLATGDKIRITQGGKSQEGKRLTNGSIYEVKDFDRDGNIIIKTGRHGKENAVIGKDYGNMAHGYTVTSHASQGLSVDRVFIAQSADSFPASSKEQFYVSCSRGKEAVRIYTDDKQGLMDQVKQSDNRISATELTLSYRQQPRFRREYPVYLAKVEQSRQHQPTPTRSFTR